MSDEVEEHESSSENPARPGEPAPDTQSGGDPPPDPLPKPGGDASDTYSSSSDPYGYSSSDGPEALTPDTAGTLSPGTALETAKSPEVLPARTPPKPPSPPPPPDEDEDAGDEEEGMLRMSFMGHLEELRSRILKALSGLVVAFLLSMFFTKELWRIVSEPARAALTHLGINPPDLVAITPMEQFNIIWLYMPLLVSVFMASPWLLYQVWAFISPGLYKREKRWAVPFILCTAGLFITGGTFAYFVAFRYGLEFLLGIGRDANVRPMVSISEYFDLFVNVTLGVALVFEMPVIIFFLTLLRLASPRFLMRHSRYAILGIVVLAAIVTPTPDIFNMMIFAVPMVMLFFVGVFASYLLVLRREEKRMPWKLTSLVLLGVVLIAAGVAWYFSYRYGYHYIPKWPFVIR